jgi:murein DD-endopeptidase MepM/ murein hydrolase activator NlpD
MKPRGVTIVVHTDGDVDSKQYRFPLLAVQAGKWGALVVGLLVVLFFAFAGPIFRAAARVPGLEGEVARLREDNGRVQQLAAALSRAEANYQALRQMLGGRTPRDSVVAIASPELMRAAPVRVGAPSGARRYETGASPPSHWPLDVEGFVTRGRVGIGAGGDGVETHEGIDIAAPIGTPVRASGGGTVTAAGTDPDYGLFALLRHPGGYESMYGHASRLLVHEGQEVSAGQVIALTGNSGRSTAPHLHFEVRRQGQSLDPLAFVKEGN